MMIIVNRPTADVISGSFNGKPFGVAYTEPKWNAMKDVERRANAVETVDELKPLLDEFELLTVESYKHMVETASPHIWVNPATNQFFLKLNSAVISNQPLPKAFVDRILTSVDKKIEVLPIIKAWVRFLRNPNYSATKARKLAEYINATYLNQAMVSELIEKGLSHEAAVARATSQQVAITIEGILVCYKVSEEVDWKFTLDADTEEVMKKARYTPTVDDITGTVTYDTPQFVEERIFRPAYQKDRGDAFYCGDALGHIIKVGKVHYLPSWDMVDCNDSTSAVPGLHVGNLDYIRGYQNEGTVTHYVYVDPMHIGAIVGGSDGAMRVKQYQPFASFAGPNKGIYHSSKYAAHTDAEYTQMMADAIATTGKLEQGYMDKVTEETKQRQALI